MKVVMPKIGMTMEDGRIAKWYCNDGERIVEGEPMLDIETEKLTNTVPAVATGIFKQLVDVDDIVDCGAVIAEIIEE